MKRRDFLRRSAAATAAIALPTFVPSGVFAAAGRLGANDRIQVGFIGVGGRARWIMTKEELKENKAKWEELQKQLKEQQKDKG